MNHETPKLNLLSTSESKTFNKLMHSSLTKNNTDNNNNENKKIEITNHEIFHLSQIISLLTYFLILVDIIINTSKTGQDTISIISIISLLILICLEITITIITIKNSIANKKLLSKIVVIYRAVTSLIVLFLASRSIYIKIYIDFLVLLLYSVFIINVHYLFIIYYN